MATLDYADLGGYPVFPLPPLWDTEPKIKYTPERDIIGFEGTSQDLIPTLYSLPCDITVDVGIDTRADEKILFDFFNTQKGRWKKFWMKLPVRNYALYDTLYAEQTSVYLKLTGLDTVYHGYERFYLDNAAGDCTIRKMQTLTRIDDPGYLKVDLNSAVNLTWAITDKSIAMGRVALVRFDHDDLVANYKTDENFVITLKMKELLYEYGEV